MEWALLFILQWNGMLWKGANPLFQISCLSSIRREVWNKSVRFSFDTSQSWMLHICNAHCIQLSCQNKHQSQLMLEKHPVLSLIIYFALNNRWLQLSSEDILQENTWNQTRADDNKYGYVYNLESQLSFICCFVLYSQLCWTCDWISPNKPVLSTSFSNVIVPTPYLNNSVATYASCKSFSKQSDKLQKYSFIISFSSVFLCHFN